MIELFRGKIQLQNPLVAQHAKSHINNKRILDPTEQWYERSIEKFIYWYTEISRIKYPMSAVVGGSELIGIHPGTSRLVAQYLKGIKSADCIMLCIMHQDSKSFMYEIMPDAKPIDCSQVVACPNHDTSKPIRSVWQFRLQEDAGVLKNIDIHKTNKRYFWSLHPGHRWFYNNKLLLDRSKPGETPRDIAIVYPSGLYQSITHLIDDQPQSQKIGSYYFIN